MIRALFLSLLILGTPLFAASPEYLVGGTVSLPAPGHRSAAAVATDGTDFLAAWVDFRSPTQRALIATRLTREGRVLDPLGIRIAATPGGIDRAGIVWDGDAYLLVWTVLPSPDGIHSLNAARIDRDGHMVLPPRALVEGAILTSREAIATNGNAIVVAYHNWKEPYGPRILALDRDANTLSDESLSPGNVWAENFSIAATPSRFAVAWSQRNGFNPDTLHAAALTSDGRLAGAPVLLGEGGFPRIGSDGSRFLLVSTREAVEARVLDADLNVIGGVKTLTSEPHMHAGAILWRNGRYEMDVALAGLGGAASTKVLDTDGNVVDSRPRDRGAFTAATNGGEVLALFGEQVPTNTHPQLFAALYRGTSRTAERAEVLPWSGNGHTSPVVVAGPSGQLVAWVEESGVYATRVDANGSSLDGRGVQLAPKGSSDVRVAFDGTDYVAAWVDGNAIGVCNIAPATGAKFNATRFEAAVWNGIALAASPDAIYVVWADERVHLQEIPYSRTTPPALPIPISPGDMLAAAPAASWNGSTLLVTWNRMEYLAGTPPVSVATATLAARVTQGLDVLDAVPLVVTGDLDVYEGEVLGVPAVASDGSGWLIVTGLARNRTGHGVLARRVLSNGAVEGNGPERIATGAAPAVAWDGTRYAVAWKDGANVLVAAVPGAGSLIASRGRLVATNAAPSALSIAPAANGEAAVVYAKESFLPQHTGVERTFLRFMDYGIPRGRVIRR